MRNIPIFFTFDDNYVEPAAVAFWSLLNKTKPNVFWSMYVLSSHISSSKKKLLSDIVSKFQNASISFCETNNFLDEEWKNNTFSGKQGGTIFTSDAILRCFAGRFFPQYDKIIYSDVDVIFVDDISELYDIPIQDKYLAAVKNVFMKYRKYELSHLNQEHYEMLKDSYFGGGLWVLNLEKIRNDDLESKMLDIIGDRTIVKRWNDQDIMNIACENKVAYIPLNYISFPYLDDYLLKNDFVSHYTREEMYDSIINPKIIHFAGQKPWNSNPKYSNLWWSIFNYLELKETSIFSNTRDKYKKYKKLFNIMCILCCTLIFLIIYLVW